MKYIIYLDQIVGHKKLENTIGYKLISLWPYLVVVVVVGVFHEYVDKIQNS